LERRIAAFGIAAGDLGVLGVLLGADANRDCFALLGVVGLDVELEGARRAGCN